MNVLNERILLELLSIPTEERLAHVTRLTDELNALEAAAIEKTKQEAERRERKKQRKMERFAKGVDILGQPINV